MTFRSGSSFTGDLLSASKKAAYFYEPFFKVKDQVEQMKENGGLEDMIRELFNCNRVRINGLGVTLLLYS